MAIAYLIRHGQASAHADDYDQLSELGYEQCRQLKKHLLEQEIHPTTVLYGPRKRHRQSYETARSSTWPSGEMCPALDEYPAHELLEFGMEQLLAQVPDLRPQAEHIRSSTGSAGEAYVDLLQHSAALWMRGKITDPRIESYTDYKQRMQSISERLRQADSEECFVLFSSAGFISTLLSFLVDGSPKRSLNTAWALYNGCINVLLIRDDILIGAVNHIQYLPSDSRTFI